MGMGRGILGGLLGNTNPFKMKSLLTQHYAGVCVRACPLARARNTWVPSHWLFQELLLKRSTYSQGHPLRSGQKWAMKSRALSLGKQTLRAFGCTSW